MQIVNSMKLYSLKSIRMHSELALDFIKKPDPTWSS